MNLSIVAFWSSSEQAVPYVDHAEQKNAPKSSEELLEVHAAAARIALIAFPAVPSADYFHRCSLFRCRCLVRLRPRRFIIASCFRCPSSSSLVDMHVTAPCSLTSIAHVHVRFADLVGDQPLDLLHLAASCGHLGFSVKLSPTNIHHGCSPRHSPCFQTHIAPACLAMHCTSVHARCRSCSCHASVVHGFDALSEVAFEVCSMAFSTWRSISNDAPQCVFQLRVQARARFI